MEHFEKLALDSAPYKPSLKKKIKVQWLGLALSKGPNSIGFFPHPRTETDPVSETSCFPWFVF
jgi:hypothetical protein